MHTLRGRNSESNMLTLENIVKTYGAKRAVDQVSFEVPRGALFGLLGPNGAGKTSLIRIITTITRADSGRVIFGGEVLGSRHPGRIGYLPEERGLYRKMRVGEHLLYLARLKGMPARPAREKLGEWLDRFGISDWWNKKVEELSKGMQQKMQFIATVVHEPELIILDEPFSGLDPINTRLIKDEILNLNRKGSTILFSTHRMEQVEELCERIVLIHEGKNVLNGRVADVRLRFKKNLFRIAYAGELPEHLPSGISIREREADAVVVKVESEAAANHLLAWLLDKGLFVRSYNEILPSLNDIFIQVVGEEGEPLLLGGTVDS